MEKSDVRLSLGAPTGGGEAEVSIGAQPISLDAPALTSSAFGGGEDPHACFAAARRVPHHLRVDLRSFRVCRSRPRDCYRRSLEFTGPRGSLNRRGAVRCRGNLGPFGSRSGRTENERTPLQAAVAASISLDLLRRRVLLAA